MIFPLNSNVYSLEKSYESAFECNAKREIRFSWKLEIFEEMKSFVEKIFIKSWQFKLVSSTLLGFVRKIHHDSEKIVKFAVSNKLNRKKFKHVTIHSYIHTHKNAMNNTFERTEECLSSTSPCHVRIKPQILTQV